MPRRRPQGPPRPVITTGNLGERNRRQIAAGNDPATEQIQERINEGLATPTVAPTPITPEAPRPIAVQDTSFLNQAQGRRRRRAGSSQGGGRTLLTDALLPSANTGSSLLG